MTPYEILSKRLTEHVYKKGAHKGDAPLEKRTKSHIRIRRVDDTAVAVHMYRTDILVARNDGTIRLNLDGWDTSTTRQWLNYAFNITRLNLGFSNKSVQSLSQPTVRTPYGYYLYYDGMEFDSTGRLLTKPMPFEARRINKLETAEFMRDIEESGFKAMYPILYAAATVEDYLAGRYDSYIAEHALVTSSDRASEWVRVIAGDKYETSWSFATRNHETTQHGDSKACWSRIMKRAKSTMYETIRTEVTVIPL